MPLSAPVTVLLKELPLLQGAVEAASAAGSGVAAAAAACVGTPAEWESSMAASAAAISWGVGVWGL